MTTSSTVAATSPVHPFERAGLGKAPFRYVGHSEHKFQACPGAPIQPGTSCDFCSTGIMDAYWIKSADGKRFKVGCDCVKRLEMDYLLINAVTAAANKVKRDAKAVKDAAKIAGIPERLEALRAELATMPHPTAFMANKGLTFADWADWMMEHAGTKGRLEVAKVLGWKRFQG